MKVEVVHPYDAGISQVLDAFFDESVIHEKNNRLGNRNVTVTTRDRDESAGKLVVARDVATSVPVPKALSGFHRPWNAVRQEEHWFRKDDQEWHCEFRIHVDGVPAKIRGDMRLKDNGDVCTNHVSLDVRCDVPLLGKKIARFLVEDSRYKMEREYDVTRELMA